MHTFLGLDIPAEVCSWSRAASQVGSVVYLGDTRRHLATDKVKRQVRGHVSLTRTLLEIIENDVEYGGKKLRSMGKDDVNEFFKENLHWRVSSVSYLQYPDSDYTTEA